MPASAPHGFFFFVPPSKESFAVSNEEELAHVLPLLSPATMVNRVDVDSGWVKATDLEDFAALIRS
jgi:hypothetical protein